jgi:N-acetyl-1-D-myo-inositol-2-amino-2-deoxy-alpha-D-glucopyranoside deacetylase
MPGLLSFHAHPDDESLSMGATLARYSAAGEQVVVVTATRGEAGEVHNHDDAEDVATRLGEVREVELEAAIKELGVPHHEYLGYEDSGMMGTPENDADNAFWRADFMEATRRLVCLIRRYQPEVMTAYDPYGGYGHPDHIQVHRVGTAAFFGAGDTARFPVGDGEEAWTPSKLYWATFPRSAVMAMIRARLEAGEITEEEAVEPGAGSLDADITLWVESPDFAEAKERAVLAHHSQIPPDSWFRSLSEDTKLGFLGREPFTRVFSRVPVPEPEHDLFAGLR